MTRHKLHGDGDYSWDAAVRPQPKTESRIEREMRIEKRVADQHYDKVPHGDGNISSLPLRLPCPECAAGVRWFTYSVSGYWQPPKPAVPKGFRR